MMVCTWRHALLTPAHSCSLLLSPLHSCSLLLTPAHSSLLFTTFHYSSLLLTTPHYSALLRTTPHYSSLPHTTPHHSSLLRTTPHYSSLLLTTPLRSPGTRFRAYCWRAGRVLWCQEASRREITTSAYYLLLTAHNSQYLLYLLFSRPLSYRKYLPRVRGAKWFIATGGSNGTQTSPPHQLGPEATPPPPRHLHHSVSCPLMNGSHSHVT